MTIPIPPCIERIIDVLHTKGIRPVFVGGFVRDALMGRESLDLDIELYHAPGETELEAILSSFGKLNSVGKSFGVLKLAYEGYGIDFAPPRTESKLGSGHKGFEITCHENIEFSVAARRRDFTINAIGYDPIDKRVLDPFGGLEDIRNRRLACVDPQTFVEDPLRVLRAVQFAARFELECDAKLLSLCQSMIASGAFEELPKERIFEEIKKLLLLSTKPSIGMKLLKEMDGLAFFTPLERFESTPQDPASHPEGNVWIHLLMALDAMASDRTGDPKRDLVLMLAVLLHDIGKPDTTRIENNLLNAPGHAEEGVEIARKWLLRITEDKSLIEAVLPLVRYHGWPRKLLRKNADDAEIRHLSANVCIDSLIRVARADYFGREFNGPVPETFDAGEWLFERSQALGVLYAPPEPLVLGRDLIAQGLKPSKRFKPLLDAAYDAQLNGLFSTREEGIAWLVTKL